MKKILHFLPDNQVWGGIEVYLNHTLPRLKERGHYDVVAAVTKGGRLASELQESGIKVCELPTHLKSPFLRPFDFRVMFSLLKILEREKPDLVHVHKGRFEQAVIPMSGYPLVYTYHGYGGPNNLENAPNDVLRTIYACSTPLLRALQPFLSGMTVVSDYERRRLYREGYLSLPFQSEVLYNGLPVQKMLQDTRHIKREKITSFLDIPQEVDNDCRLVLFACRLTRDKNADAYLRIMQEVLNDPARKNPVYFIVAGDGPMAPMFKRAFTEDPILSRHGRYIGFCSNIHQLTTICDMTVSTSLQEGFGLRVLESLLFGKPCITYAAGGIPEVMALPEANDWLVPSGNEAEFVRRLVNTINLSDAELQRLSPILQKHAERFDIQLHVQNLENFYYRTFAKLENPSQIARPLQGQTTTLV